MVNWNLNFLERFSDNTEISNFMKIRPVGDELFHAEGRTDRHDEANSRFSQFFPITWKRVTSTENSQIYYIQQVP